MKLIKILIVPAFVLVLGLAPLPVLAHGDEVKNATTRENAEERLSELQAKREAAREERQAKLQEVQDSAKERFKQACENRKASYQTRLNNLAERSDSHLAVLDKILERVKTFKETKNLSLANYDQLAQIAEGKKHIVHDLQDTAKQKAAEDFNCERTTALEQVKTFKDILAQQIDALKDYKTAIKNLIAAIKEAAQEQRNAN